MSSTKRYLVRNKKAVILCMCVWGFVAARQELEGVLDRGGVAEGLIYFSNSHLLIQRAVSSTLAKAQAQPDLPLPIWAGQTQNDIL